MSIKILELNPYIEYPIYRDTLTAIDLIECLIDELINQLEESIKEVNCIRLFCRGSSGAYIAGLVSYMLYKDHLLNVEVFYSRKENENAHSKSLDGYKPKIVGDIDVFIDDRIESGDTIDKTILDIFRVCNDDDEIEQHFIKFDYILVGTLEDSKMQSVLVSQADNIIIGFTII